MNQPRRHTLRSSHLTFIHVHFCLQLYPTVLVMTYIAPNQFIYEERKKERKIAKIRQFSHPRVKLIFQYPSGLVCHTAMISFPKRNKRRKGVRSVRYCACQFNRALIKSRNFFFPRMPSKFPLPITYVVSHVFSPCPIPPPPAFT